MSTNPSLEARVHALERQQIVLNAHIAEVSLDTNASYKQISSYLEKLDTRMDEIEGDLDTIKGDIVSLDQDIIEIKGDVTGVKNDITGVKGDVTKIKNDITGIKGDITGIKATMATKEELAAMESRMLDAFQQLAALVSSQRP